jgi:hypothetical protein
MTSFLVVFAGDSQKAMMAGGATGRAVCSAACIEPVVVLCRQSCCRDIFRYYQELRSVGF